MEFDHSAASAATSPPSSRGAFARSVPAAVTTITFTEGPTFDSRGNLYFSDVRGNRILKLDREGHLDVYRSPANFANGMVCDDNNRLWVCEEGAGGQEGRSRITCTDLETGSCEIVVDAIDGERLRGPKDITYDGQGRIYFTDGSRPFFLKAPEADERYVPGSGVYRIDPDRTVSRVLDWSTVDEPNGIAISPDDRFLYIIENNPHAGGRRQLMAFDLKPDGSAGEGRLLHDFGTGRSGDGLSVDAEGNLWVAAGLNALRGLAETLDNPAGIYVFSPCGHLRDIIPIAEDSVTNTTFGGEDLRKLYVTAGKTIYSFDTRSPGLRR
ncbi:SMP-30/gluconolactonase/LRE family protein [Neorhizobium sp. DT-125]|uniref:SMP-30/gluconolactonase/LRE family protein n=1 Tax=Neorhizobium sp. DT-125 TaxID=3396163 RepID=UPI003F1A0F82